MLILYEVKIYLRKLKKETKSVIIKLQHKIKQYKYSKRKIKQNSIDKALTAVSEGDKREMLYLIASKII